MIALAVVTSLLFLSPSPDKVEKPRGGPTPTGPSFGSASDLFSALRFGGIECDRDKWFLQQDGLSGQEQAECHMNGVHSADIYVFESGQALDLFLDERQLVNGRPAIDAVLGSNWLVSAQPRFLRRVQAVLGGTLYLPR